MKKPLIFFDFDGVIADSWAPALQAQRIICPAITDQEYAQLYTGNINESQRLGLGHSPACRHDLAFFDVYLPLMKGQTKLFDGIAPVIAQLAEKYTLIIISSTTSPVIQEFLAERDLATHFAAILGNDVHKKKTEKIKMMLYRYDVEPHETLFITDTLGDLHEAGHMKVAAVAVSWGFNDIPTLQKGNPWRIVDTPADITAAVQDYFL